MALKQLFTNNAVSLLAAPISSASTTLTVMAGHGSLYPNITEPDQFFLVTLENETASAREIVKVNGRVGDVFTGLQRGWEDTTPLAWTAGPGGDTLVDHRVTAGSLTNLYTEPAGGTADARIYDASFSLSNTASTTVLTFSAGYVSGSTAVWVGGARQKRGIDYAESGPLQITLNFLIDQTMIDEGQNIVVDLTPA